VDTGHILLLERLVSTLFSVFSVFYFLKIFMTLLNVVRFVLCFFTEHGDFISAICTNKLFLAPPFVSYDTLLVWILLECMMSQDNFLCCFLDTTYMFHS